MKKQTDTFLLTGYIWNYNFIKGGVLHVHYASILTSDWIVKNVTYREDLYLKIDNITGNEIWNFKFLKNPNDDWKLVKDLRNSSQNPEKFDSLIFSKLTMKTHHPYTDIDDAWFYFENIFALVTPMISYKSVFQDYFYEAMHHFRNDNVQYIELRINLPEVYELDGTTLKPNAVVKLIKDVSDKFTKEYQDFFGIRIIYTVNRNVQNPEEHILLFKELQREFPDFILGFDLVGQEDRGTPLAYLVEALQELGNGRYY